MKDLILTWIGGKEFCEHPGVSVFLNSIKKVGFDGDVVVFTSDMPDVFRTKLYRYGYKIVDIPRNQVSIIVFDRFLHYWEFLIKSNYRNVFQVDSKDVVFQQNPSDIFQESGKVYFIPEGMIHFVSIWNNADQFKFQRHILPNGRSEWHDWPVLNAGTIIGDAKVLADFNLLLWNTTCRSPFLKTPEMEISAFTDQAALNYLYYCYIHKDPKFASFEMQKNNFCLTGEAVAQGYLKIKPYFENGLVRDENGTFCMFHQWERTEFKDTILNDYKSWTNLKI